MCLSKVLCKFVVVLFNLVVCVCVCVSAALWVSVLCCFVQCCDCLFEHVVSVLGCLFYVGVLVCLCKVLRQSWVDLLRLGFGCLSKV